MSNIVYSATYDETVLNGIPFQSDFEILSPGRNIQLKSITLTHKIVNATLDTIYPLESNVDQFLWLLVGNYTNMIANAFSNISDPPSNAGNLMIITQPQQYFFDSFFINNRIPLTLYIRNGNAAGVRRHLVSIIIETTEKIIY